MVPNWVEKENKTDSKMWNQAKIYSSLIHLIDVMTDGRDEHIPLICNTHLERLFCHAIFLKEIIKSLITFHENDVIHHI